MVQKDVDEWHKNSVSFYSTNKAMNNFQLRRDSSGSPLGLISATTSKTLTRSRSVAQRENLSSSYPNYQHQSRRLSSSSILSSDTEMLITPMRALPKSTFMESHRIQEPTVDPYRILGLRRNATCNEIRRNYLRLALLNHPHRKHPSSDKLSEQIRRWKFITIAASYETLFNTDRRTNYNFANRDRTENGWSTKSKTSTSFWDDVKRGLEISDRDEKRLDHDGVQCCAHDSIFGHWNGSDSESLEARDDDGSSVGLLSSKKPPMCRGDSDNTTNTDASTDDSSGREADQLFGGVLGPLYKARNHEGFTDSFELFRKVSGSNIYRFDSAFKKQVEIRTSNQSDFIAQNWLIATASDSKLNRSFQRTSRSLIDDDCSVGEEEDSTSLQCQSSSTTGDAKMIYPSLPTLPRKVRVDLCNETPPCLGDRTSIVTKTVKETRHGLFTTITTKCRRVDNYFLVRTERVIHDPISGKKKIHIEVKGQAGPIEADNDGSNDTFLSTLANSLSGPFVDASDYLMSGCHQGMYQTNDQDRSSLHIQKE